MIACTLVPSPEHTIYGHPENPERFERLDGLRALEFPTPINWLQPEPADLTKVSKVHDPEMVSFLQEACREGPAIIDAAPTFVTRHSWQAALDAAGGALTCTRQVLEGKAIRGFALVRPPGHHAESRNAMGFCLLNNLAIAVQDALDEGLEKVLIVDYDAHHGNGTQDIFLQEERVTFVSTHQKDIYPGTGKVSDAPNARGRILNLPLPAYAGDQAFKRVVDEIIRPLAVRLQPEMIFVSAGFDAHWSDPLTTLGVSTLGFFHISQALIGLADQFCQGRIVYVLEGGYDPKRLADNVRAVLGALAGEEEVSDPEGPSPYSEPDISPLINRIRDLHL
jgi:acetoin utilization deacetylase AcuC-like enzyme